MFLESDKNVKNEKWQTPEVSVISTDETEAGSQGLYDQSGYS